MPTPKEVLFPHSTETIPPDSVRQAVIDCVRWCELKGGMRRDAIKAAMMQVDAGRIVLAVQGKTASGRPEGIELFLANTVDACVRAGITTNPIDAVTAIASVREELRDGGVFVGEERQQPDARWA